MSNLSRRALLAGLGISAANTALAKAPASSIIPLARPMAQAPAAQRPDVARDVVGELGLSGKTAYVVADARSGRLLASYNPLLAMPTASVAKAITAQYALDALGRTHSFVTRIMATGALAEGVVEGDLILVGGGDPMLDTKDLAGLVDTVVARGIRAVRGRFLYFAGPLPQIEEIDGKQPAHVGYNPAVSGLNLNFNRIYFGWKKNGDGYDVELDARSEIARPQVDSIQLSLAERGSPVYDYRKQGQSEIWSVSRRALGTGGGRWLPVRQPDTYAAEVVQALAAAKGLQLTRPEPISKLPRVMELARHHSLPLHRVLRSMMYYSTNLIAEVVGLNASLALGNQPGTLRASAANMSDWMQRHLGARRPRFVDHSGLGDTTRVTAQDMANAMVRIGPDSTLAAMMRKFPLPKEANGISVVAKTGSLNFVSGLSGFANIGGRDLAFAIFSADLPRRQAILPQERERPRGAKPWATQARVLQHELIMDWARRFSA